MHISILHLQALDQLQRAKVGRGGREGRREGGREEGRKMEGKGSI